MKAVLGVSLVNDVNFWYKLKVDYESVSDGPTRLENLISEFFKGRKPYVEKKIGDPVSFIQKAGMVSEEKIRETLFAIYINHLWSQSKSGPSFRTQDGKNLDESLRAVYSELAKDDIVIQEASDGFVIVYHIRPSLVDESDATRKEVHGKKLLAAETSLIRVTGDSLEMRGRGANLTLLKKKLSDGGIEEVKPTLDSKPIISSLNTALEHENPIFDIIGIKYSGTNLPSKSRLTLQNTVSIGEDIRHLGENDIIIPNAITDISQILFWFKKLGKKVKLKVKHRDEGIEFEIDDKKLTEAERNEIKAHLEKTFDISFDKVHDYVAQFDERFIFHKILAGNVTVYEKYFSSLKGPIKKFLEQAVSIESENYWICSKCDRETDQSDSCPHCEGDVKKHSRKKIVVKEPRLFALLSDKIEELETGHKIEGLKVGGVEYKTLGDKKVLRISVFRTEYADSHAVTRHYSFYVHPLGDDHLSHRVNDLLLNTVLVTYGPSAHKLRYDANFGVIDLYKLMRGDDPATLLRDAIDMSNRLKERRLVEASIEARQHLERLGKDEEYTDKNFERDCFFLLKRMFPFSERWGKEGKREADGVAVFGDEDDEYFVASYDPKFTKSDFYDLDSEEQNKAVFYILNENANKEISSLTKRGKIDAHILISNGFKENQLKTYYEGVKKFMKLTKGDKSGSPPPIVFLLIGSLLDIYRIYDSNWAEIKGNVKFHKEFFKLVTELLKPTDGYKLVKPGDIAEFEASVIALKDRIKHKSSITRA